MLIIITTDHFSFHVEEEVERFVCNDLYAFPHFRFVLDDDLVLEVEEEAVESARLTAVKHSGQRSTHKSSA